MQHPIEGFRLSPQQKNSWIQQQAIGKLTLNTLCEVEIDGNLQLNVLRDAVQAVINRHEILRTKFQRQAGIKTPFQVVAQTIEIVIENSDLSGLTTAEQQSARAAQFA